MEDYERYYIAGLLEGEGCFTLLVKNGRLYPRVSVAMTDEDVILRIADIVSTGSIQFRKRQNKKWKPIWTFCTNGLDAVNLMQEILPFMCSRREQKIREILDMLDKQSPLRKFERPRQVNSGKLCSIKGCDRQAIARGWCRRHYSQWEYHTKRKRKTG